MMGVYEHDYSTRGIYYRKPEVIAFVVNAGVNTTANNFYI